MRNICLFLLIFSALNTKAIIFFASEDLDAGKKLAATPLFSPVGILFIRDKEGEAYATATVYGKGDKLLTAAHNVKDALELSFSLTGRSEDTIAVLGHAIDASVDIAVLQLERAIEAKGVELPTLGRADPKKLAAAIWDSLPSAPGMPYTRHFAIAGFGRVSTRDKAVAEQQMEKHAGYMYLSSRPTVLRKDPKTGMAMATWVSPLSSAPAEGSIFITTIEGALSPKAMGSFGDSGAPVFMRNERGDNQWRLVGIHINGDETKGLISVLTPGLQDLISTTRFTPLLAAASGGATGVAGAGSGSSD
jgi:hypothetical protein